MRTPPPTSQQRPPQSSGPAEGITGQGCGQGSRCLHPPARWLHRTQALTGPQRQLGPRLAEVGPAVTAQGSWGPDGHDHVNTAQGRNGHTQQTPGRRDRLSWALGQNLGQGEDNTGSQHVLDITGRSQGFLVHQGVMGEGTGDTRLPLPFFFRTEACKQKGGL